MSDTTDTTEQLTPEGEPDVVATEDVAGESEDLVLESPSQMSADPMDRPSFAWGTGRRKSSVARVRVIPGTGKVQVKRSGGNYREINDYFQNERDRTQIFGPLEASQYAGKLDVYVNANGGGSTGQAGAIVMGLARAIARYDPESEASLREQGFLTRDSRMKERKKYGQRGARRKFQFSKR